MERSNRRFEGLGKRQDLLVRLLLQVDGPTKALADVVPCLVIHFADVVFWVKEVNAYRNTMGDCPENPRALA